MAGGGKTEQQSSTPAEPDKAASQTQTQEASTKQTGPAKPATPQVLLDLQGSGTKQTQKFTAASDWDLEWSYDCSNFGQQGNFIVTVYDGDGNMSFDNTAVNQLGKSGSDVQHYYKGGTYYLSVNSECKWHIVASSR